MRQDFDEMPAMLSAIRVAGMWSCCNSQTVRRAPRGEGRGSSAKKYTLLPDSTAARGTPSAVPWPAVDSAPSLQCVSTVLLSGTGSRPLAWLTAISSPPGFNHCRDKAARGKQSGLHLARIGDKLVNAGRALRV